MGKKEAGEKTKRSRRKNKNLPVITIHHLLHLRNIYSHVLSYWDGWYIITRLYNSGTSTSTAFVPVKVKRTAVVEFSLSVIPHPPPCTPPSSGVYTLVMWKLIWYWLFWSYLVEEDAVTVILYNHSLCSLWNHNITELWVLEVCKIMYRYVSVLGMIFLNYWILLDNCHWNQNTFNELSDSLIMEVLLKMVQ